MSQSEAAVDAVAQIQSTIENGDLLSDLEDAQEEAREEYDDDTMVNATISGDGSYEIQDVTDGIPDDAVHIAGIVALPDRDNRQFTDLTIMVSSSYDTREVVQAGLEDDSLMSSVWDEGAEWRVIPNPTHDDNPTVWEALGELVKETVDQGFDINVTLQGAEDLLDAE